MATDYEQKYKGALERAKKFKDKYGGDYAGYIFPELAESEDERIRRWLCDYFSSIDKAWIHKDITCIDILRWLEKQKEQNLIMANSPQLKEQKPAEWSEEDEKDMAHIIRILDDCYVYGTHDLSKTDHENLVNKLKFLRPHWKPTEEQMRALNEIVNILAASPFLHQNDYLFNILNGLREELKKLL